MVSEDTTCTAVREVSSAAAASCSSERRCAVSVSYTHLRAHETRGNLVCRLLLEKKKTVKRKNTKKSAAPETHHEIHNSAATATATRRRATKHVPRVSPYLHASSIDPGFVEIGLASIHTYSHCCSSAHIRFGALFSRQRSFFLYCDMYLRFRGCPVVLDIELCVSA